MGLIKHIMFTWATGNSLCIISRYIVFEDFQPWFLRSLDNILFLGLCRIQFHIMLDPLNVFRMLFMLSDLF